MNAAIDPSPEQEESLRLISRDQAGRGGPIPQPMGFYRGTYHQQPIQPVPG